MSNDWIENTGVCPVEDGEIIDIKFADGGVALKTTGHLLIWSKSLGMGTITHYRICEVQGDE